MRISRSIYLLLTGLVVAVLLSAAAGSYFFLLQNQAAEGALQSGVAPVEEALTNARVRITQYTATIESSLSQLYTDQRLGLNNSPQLLALQKDVADRLLTSDKTHQLLDAKQKELFNAQVQTLIKQKERLDYLLSQAKQDPDEYETQAYQYVKDTIAAQQTLLLSSLAGMESALKSQKLALLQQINRNALIAAGCLGLGFLTVVVLFVLIFLTIQKSIAKPIQTILERAPKRQKMRGGTGHELDEVVAHINRLQDEVQALQSGIEQLAEGTTALQLNENNLAERQILALMGVARRYRQHADELRQVQKQLEQTRQEAHETQAQLQQQCKALQADLARMASGLLTAELNPDFTLQSANTELLLGFGYHEAQLAEKRIPLLDDSASSLKNDIRTQLERGQIWQGVLGCQTAQGSTQWVSAILSPSTNGFLLKAQNVTELKNRQLKLEQELTDIRQQLKQAEAALKQSEDALKERQQAIETLRQEAEQAAATAAAQLRAEAQRAEEAATQLSDLQAQLNDLSQREEKLRRDLSSLKQLEYRLMQQQAALQELTRNQDLKEGNVREALRSITETALYALDDERMGLWLFTENGDRIRCLDLYERHTMRHTNSLEIARGEAPGFFETLLADRVIDAATAQLDPRTFELKNTYLKANGIEALLAVPIRLGGSIVGALMAEHTGSSRPWMPDEQNFVLSVADVVSLALEQGNRRLMEEELRMTLEESQALEEELRQNAEEIEATNEEMRRTQVELRGQINALNNAAIVSETNLEGFITYANNEFTHVYKFTKKEVLGQNHRLIKSGYHQPEFYEGLWQTIKAGKVWQGEIKNRAKSGEVVWVFTTITPVIGVDHKVYKFINVSFDITAQKMQEEQVQAALDVALQQETLLRENAQALQQANEEMIKTQLELAGQIRALNTSSLLFEIDMNGKILNANDALLRRSGWIREELVGQDFAVLRSGRQPETMYNDMWKKIREGKTWRSELELKRVDGKPFWVINTSTPVMNENDEPLKVINVLFDVDEQKQQEFRLKRQQTALLELNSNSDIKEGNLEQALRVICRIGKDTLAVSRASIWLVDKDNSEKVRCVSMIDENDQPIHTEGTVLERSMYPVYFRTLERDIVLAANNALEDPRTSEIAYSLLRPAGVSSVLDASVRTGGEMRGLISFEHVGLPRDWELDEQAFISSLADTIGLLLEQKTRQMAEQLQEAFLQLEQANKEMLRQKAEIEETSTTLTESMRYAKRIQQNILPSKDVLGEYLENYFVIYRPRDIVGGDFYWFAAQGDLNIIVVADGTGHGAPGAFLTLIGYLLLNQIVNEKRITRPADILYHLHIGVRTALKQDAEDSTSRDGMDVAILTYNRNTLQAQFAGANLPLNYYQDWEIHEIKPDKKSIGGEQMEEERIFTNHEIQFKPGDAVYMYTDGFVDQLGGPDEKRFSTRRFRDLVLRTQHESMATQRALLNLEWKEWKDDREQLDDVTLFGIKF